ncbi:hypothetical protein GBN32_14130 [Plesiomonas shigelloides]|uniref:hypothetical protein n=1 Tax=Plesiomonas shigelloides TaxID=703 RepID=UPI001261D5EF|nr:hypothetical protein [Plesiomonas shigelloides]KAB7707307.1 hypothetical protein GBN32_14130 [Plesiomonas shigelloides]
MDNALLREKFSLNNAVRFIGEYMEHSDWLYWFWIKKLKKDRSLERWALRHLHHRNYLNLLAERVIDFNRLHHRPCSVRVNSIWIDGTPQATAKARTKEVKCELADLLYIVEELNHKGDRIARKGILVQGKNTVHPRKIDSGNSTKKERALFEKLDRRYELTLKAGVSKTSKLIGEYFLDSTVKEGLSDCARFLLMPKMRYSFYDDISNCSPFHVTWPKRETSTEMVIGQSLTETVIEMYSGTNVGKKIIDPSNCEWSRMVLDLENGYKGVEMKGYDRQKRHYSSDICSFKVNKHLPQDSQVRSEFYGLNEELIDLKSLPYISIIKVSVQYPPQDEPNKRLI